MIFSNELSHTMVAEPLVGDFSFFSYFMHDTEHRLSASATAAVVHLVVSDDISGRD